MTLLLAYFDFSHQATEVGWFKPVFGFVYTCSLRNKMKKWYEKISHTTATKGIEPLTLFSTHDYFTD